MSVPVVNISISGPEQSVFALERQLTELFSQSSLPYSRFYFGRITTLADFLLSFVYALLATAVLYKLMDWFVDSIFANQDTSAKKALVAVFFWILGLNFFRIIVFSSRIERIRTALFPPAVFLIGRKEVDFKRDSSRRSTLINVLAVGIVLAFVVGVSAGLFANYLHRLLLANNTVFEVGKR